LRILIAVFVIFLLCSSVYAEEWDWSAVGASLAGAQTANPISSDACFYNPAVIPFLATRCFDTNYHFKREDGSNHDRGWSAGFVNPVPGASDAYVYFVKGISFYRRAEHGGTRTAATVSIANKISLFAMGLNVKYIRGPWEGDMKNTASLDLAFFMETIKMLRIGATGINLTNPKVDGFSRTLNAGVALTPIPVLTLSADLRDIAWDRVDKSKVTMRKAYGLSLDVADNASVRVGYAWKKEYCTGFEFRTSSGAVLSYAFNQDAEGLSNHSFCVGVRF
jgi:hypothetical protein